MPVQPERPIIILGAERSGSTWLTNILDAHRQTEVFLEPFAPVAEILPDFPDRLIYLENGGTALVDYVQDRFRRLDRYKYPLSFSSEKRRPGGLFSYWTLYPLIEFGATVLGYLGIPEPIAHTRFRNLNKNRLENRFLNGLDKDRPPGRTVFKELRLNFKAGLIEDVWPDAQVVVIIRNPISQVGSMLKLLNRQALHDLRRALRVVVEQARACGQFERFHGALDHAGDALAGRALAYWFLNYDALLRSLDHSSLDHHVVRHEDLSEHPRRTIRTVLEQVSLPPDDQVDTFVQWSTTTLTDSSRSAMDTRRNSQAFYLQSLQSAYKKHGHDLLSYAEPFWPSCHPVIEAYRRWIQRHTGSPADRT